MVLLRSLWEKGVILRPLLTNFKIQISVKVSHYINNSDLHDGGPRPWLGHEYRRVQSPVLGGAFDVIVGPFDVRGGAFDVPVVLGPDVPDEVLGPGLRDQRHHAAAPARPGQSGAEGPVLLSQGSDGVQSWGKKMLLL